MIRTQMFELMRSIFFISACLSPWVANAVEQRDDPVLMRLSHPNLIIIEDEEISPFVQDIRASVTINPAGLVVAAKILTPTRHPRINQHILSTIAAWRIDVNDAPLIGAFEILLKVNVKPPKVVTVQGKRRTKTDIDEDRNLNVVDQRAMAKRVVTTTPEALNYSTGVFVQRTSHGQGSPYIRGRTGQQTLLMFDGLKLNHTLFRKGPNQYLFTVDPWTLQRIEVLRGGASVEYGSDAISGAIFLHPRLPRLDPSRKNLRVAGSSTLATKSGDRSIRVRTESEAQLNPRFAVLLGAGFGQARELEAGGYSPPPDGIQDVFCDDEKSVPCFRRDGRTQIGTGYREITADLHTRFKTGRREIQSALYLYRQYDAPRTDQCPPPEAAVGECLMIEEQFRTHGYISISDQPKFRLLEHIKMALSFQRQYQHYTLTRPDRNPRDTVDTTTTNFGTDAVNGITGYLRGKSRPMKLEDINVDVRYGYDATFEQIESNKGISFAEPPTVVELSRGQYIDGSRYHQHGLYISPSMTWRTFRLRAGARQSWINANSEGDVESASQPFDKTFTPLVWNLGLRWGHRFRISASIENGFRAPNLDDLTARQSTGQGYQLENNELSSERATTIEIGLQIRLPRLKLNLFVFDERLYDAIERRLLSREECTLSSGFTDQACRANRAPLSLINLDGQASIRGIEGDVKLKITPKWTFSAGSAFTIGEGPNPDPSLSNKTPLSRIPPFNGTAELTWQSNGLRVGYGLRWALAQDRLSVGDIADARIPIGGTPGYVVQDVRVGITLSREAMMNVVIENVTDERYRAHGSSIFGAGRSINAQLKLSY